MYTKFWRNLRILITGGHGFLGQHLVKKILSLEPKRLSIPTSSEIDLRSFTQCLQAVRDIDLVIHLAAVVGGIGYNRRIPGRMLYDNLIMGTHIMEASRIAKVKKFVGIGTVCSYPKYTPVPFREENLWNGYPEETNAPYGLAKKMLLVQGQAYRQQYGFNAIYLMPTNLYGPGDNFSPYKSHVIPALIRKFYMAKLKKQKSVTVWGSGNPTREFLYVEDAVRGIILAAERYNKKDPINLGGNEEISILQLAKLIQRALNFNGQIIWDHSMPDGQPRRKLDTQKAEVEFKFHAKIPLSKGIKQTVLWQISAKK